MDLPEINLLLDLTYHHHLLEEEREEELPHQPEAVEEVAQDCMLLEVVQQVRLGELEDLLFQIFLNQVIVEVQGEMALHLESAPILDLVVI
jgi:hypothetical protein